MEKSWSSFYKRLSSLAQNTLANSRDGYVVIAVTMLVNANGEPIVWLEPDVRRIEPANLASILEKLTTA